MLPMYEMPKNLVIMTRKIKKSIFIQSLDLID